MKERIYNLEAVALLQIRARMVAGMGAGSMSTNDNTNTVCCLLTITRWSALSQRPNEQIHRSTKALT